MKKPAVIPIKSSASVNVVQAEKECCNFDCNQGRDCPLRKKFTEPDSLGAKRAVVGISLGLAAAATSLFFLWR